MNKLLLASALVGSLAFGSAQAATVNSLSDSFDSLPSQTNYAGFTNWDVMNGTVDAIQAGNPWGLTCLATGCVDLDGSTSNAGDLVSKDGFFAGTYTLEFSLSGNQRNNPSDGLLVTLGNYSENFILSPTDPWTTFIRTVTVATDGDKLSFIHAGGDNIGILLDNVSVSQVPVPAAAFLFAPALLGFLGLRRKAKQA